MMSSPLSEAPAALSTLSSYATAAQTPKDGDDKATPPYNFSSVRRLPQELERQCQIFIEEQLCTFTSPVPAA